jgi:hypothetical protein
LDKQFVRPYVKKTHHIKRAGRVAQGVDPQDPSTTKKKKKKKDKEEQPCKQLEVGLAA